MDGPGRWAGRLRGLVTGKRFLIIAAVVAVLAVAYTLAGFFLVPRLIASQVPRYAQEQLQRRAEIGEVRFNPLLFKLEIKGFRLTESDGQPLLGFDRLFVDFQLSSLFRAAWTFAEIQLEGPRLDVVLTRDGRLNLADLLDSMPKSEAPPQPADTAPPRVLLQHAVVRGGRVAFTDLSGQAPQTATVEPIDVELRSITTLRERRGPYAISATMTGGGVVGWEGEVSLVPLSSTGRLGLRGFPLATAWRFVQEDIALAEPAGRLDAEFRYQLGYRDRALALKVSDVGVTVEGLALTQRADKAPLLALDKVQLTGAHGDIVARELTVPEITVSRGRLAATMERDGTVNWQKLVVAPKPGAAVPALTTTPAPAPATAPTAAEARPWRVAIEKIRVEEIALAFADQSRAVPLAIEVAGLTLGLSARLESGAGGLTGTADGLALTLAKVAVRDAKNPKTPLASLDQVLVEGGRIDLGGRQVAVSRVAVTGGATTVVRAADGSLPMVAGLAPADGGKPARPARPAPAPARPAPAPPPPAGVTAAKPWTIALGRFDFAGHRVAVSDRSVTPAVDLTIDQIKASLRDYRSDSKKPLPFEAGFRIAQGGHFTAKGRVAPDGSEADATLSVTQLALTPTQPYVASFAAVALRSGVASTRGRLTYRSGRQRPTVTYTGTADLDRLLVVEASNGEPVVGWKSMHAETVRFGLAPDRLEIDEVRLAELDGRVTIFQDKSLSLARLMKGQPATAPPATPAEGAGAAPASTPATPASAAPAPTGGEAAPAFPVAIERVRLEQSAMHFADLSLVLPFATRVHGMNGVVVGLGSDAASRATVKIDGRVDEFGLMKIDGALSAFQPKVFTDIAVIFRNVPMSTLTPYSATFAGRRIVAGTMDIDLQYKVDRSVLIGENKVVLTKLQLGERVESAGAMRLPLDLAIAILSDSQGRIDIALPVRGNVDHPEFSYGALIWQALVTVVKNIVTSPFRALAGLFGGDAERLQAVAFEAGSDNVPPPERQKLQRVAEVLDKRPRLKLTVHGGYDAKVDGEALRALRVRQDLAQRLGATLKPGDDPGPVAFDSGKTQRALEALLGERGAGKALEEFQAGYEKSTGTKADRVNPVLALVGRGSLDRAFYEALFRRLVELAPLTDAELKALGQRRGEATARALKERAGNAAGRVEVGDIEAAGAEKTAVPTRLELGAVGS
jgi:uncharacterized protein involved in outer membrane biogenesis